MAFTQLETDLNNHQSIGTRPNLNDGLTPVQLKILYDKAANDIKDYINTVLLPALEDATAGKSASENLGSAPIAGLQGSTIYAQIANMLAVAQAAQAGTIIPGTVTDTMLSNTAGQLKSVVGEHLADFTQQIPYAVTTGTANTYTASTDPALPALVAGVAITVKIHAVNTGVSTLNWDGKGAIPIKKANGNDVSSGNLKLNGVYTLRYDGTSFILQGEGGEYGTAGAPQVLPGYTVGTENGLVSGTFSNIKSIQRGSKSISSGYNGTVAVSPVNLANCILKVDAYNLTATMLGGVEIRGTITDATTLTFNRNHSTGTTVIQWELIEFNNLKSLQSGVASLSGVTTLNVAISAVDLSKSFSCWSNEISNNIDPTPAQLGTIVKLTSPTNLNITSSASDRTFSWYVVEFN